MASLTIWQGRKICLSFQRKIQCDAYKTILPLTINRDGRCNRFIVITRISTRLAIACHNLNFQRHHIQQDYHVDSLFMALRAVRTRLSITVIHLQSSVTFCIDISARRLVNIPTVITKFHHTWPKFRTKYHCFQRGIQWNVRMDCWVVKWIRLL